MNELDQVVEKGILISMVFKAFMDVSCEEWLPPNVLPSPPEKKNTSS